MRRFLLVLAAVASALTATGSPAGARAPAGSCTPASAATYRHSFNGTRGTSTITPLRPLCAGESETFSLAAYTAPAPGATGGLFAYDISRATLTSGKQSVTLKVSVPPCFTHVYAVRGTAVPTETTSPAYPGDLLGSPPSRSTGPTAHHTGGSTPCTAAPTVTFTNRCDGTFTATVTNAATATVAVVLTSGDRLTRVAPGRSVVLTGQAGRTLTFRASNLTTYVGTWRPPSTPCPGRSALASAAPSVLPTLPLAATAAPLLSAGPSAPVAEVPEPPDFTTDAAPTSATAAQPASRAGMSTGSLLATAFGLLLIAGGALLLARLVRESRRPR